LAYADDNIVGENLDTIKKTKCMLMACYQNAEQKQSIKIADRSFEDVAKLKYLGTTPEQNSMHKEIESRLNAGTPCYHSVQSLLYSLLLSRNMKVKVYKNLNSASFIWL
jgi:hypothetical protein